MIQDQIQNKELHRVASTAIIHKDGKYLILKRALNKKVFPGKWTVPGGGLTVDDYINTQKTTNDCWYYALEKNLRREVKEEADLEIDAINYLCDLTFIRPDGIPVITLSYWANYKSGEVKLNEESGDYAWVSAEEAKNYDLIEGILDEIRLADETIKSS